MVISELSMQGRCEPSFWCALSSVHAVPSERRDDRDEFITLLNESPQFAGITDIASLADAQPSPRLATFLERDTALRDEVGVAFRSLRFFQHRRRRTAARDQLSDQQSRDAPVLV